jgi:putative ABC transport system substrate-binding protein
MKKRIFISLLATLLLASFYFAESQQPKKIPRIGFLFGASSASNADRTEAFRQGLRDLGYIEGENILIEYRYAERKLDRVPGLAAELVELKVDVLVVPFQEGILTAKKATKTIPIVMSTAQDPVATGIIESFARPGGNITGLTRRTRELSGKRLELLQEMVPGISRVGILWNVNSVGAAVGFKEYEAAARALKIHLQSLGVRGAHPDLEGAFQSASKERASALITIRNPILTDYPKQIADLAIKNRLPSMHEGSDYAEAGGLVSYSDDDLAVLRRAAVYVDKILKGAKPADLPVETPTKFELVINLKTAKQIGLTIPDSVLYRADRVFK